MSEPVRLLIVDDQRLLRAGLRLLLETDERVTVVAEAADGAEGLAMIEKWQPDVVLADARMPGSDGLDLLAARAERVGSPPVIILTTFDDDELVVGALAAGAAGFLLKDLAPDALVEAVLAVRRGDVVIDPRVTRAAVRRSDPAAPDDPLAVLTRTERVVAEHVARGATNAEIAEAMVLAEGTVKNHLSSLLRKLDRRDRTALALLVSQRLGRPRDHGPPPAARRP